MLRAQLLRSARVFGTRRWLTLTLTLAVILGISAGALFLAPNADAADGQTKYEYFFVVDTSKSMVGFEGSKNIFPEVKKTVSEYLGALDVGNTTVYIFPFDKGLSSAKPYVTDIAAQGDKATAQKQINSLKADGTATWIYQSLGAVLDQAKAVRTADPSVQHVQTVFLFTDGRNNGPVSLSDTIRKFQIARGENPYLFLKYITLGTSADPAWKLVDGLELQETPEGQAPKLLSVRVTPPVLDFGSLSQSKTSKRVVKIAFDSRLEGKQLSLSVDGKQAEAKGALTSISPSSVTLAGKKNAEGFSTMTQEVTLSVDNKDALGDSATYGGKISFGSPGSLVVFSPPQIDYTFNLASKSLISVTPPDRDTLAAALGTLDPYKGGTTIEKQIPVKLSFNDRAQTTGSYVQVRLVQTGGPKDSVVQLIGPDGKPVVDSLKVGPDAPQFAVKVVVPAGTTAGQFDYNVSMEPHAAVVEGAGLKVAAGGVSEFPVSFTVPARPEPAWKGILRAVTWLLVGLLLILIVAFVVACVVLRVGPARLWSLLMHRFSPKILDARLQILAPESAESLIDLTGMPRYSIGSGSSVLSFLPARVDFAPMVSVSERLETIEVTITPLDGEYLEVDRGTGDQPETATSATLYNGNVVAIKSANGSNLGSFTLASIDYVP